MSRIKRHLSAVAILVALLACAVSAQAVIINDDFETSYDGWGRVDDGVFSTVTAVSGEGYKSSRGMVVTDRATPEDGASALKGFDIEDGVVYNYGVYVKHTGKSAETFNLTLSWKLPGEVKGKDVIATAVVKPNTWTPINVSYATPKGSYAPEFKITTNSTNDFIFDKFTATGRSSLAKSAAMPPANVGLKDIYAKHFRVGNILHGGAAGNTGIQNVYKLDYNSVTAENEHKPNDYLERSGSTDTDVKVKISSGARSIMNFCNTNNIPLRGHVLTWHGQTPDWFFISNMQDANWQSYRNGAKSSIPWASKAVMKTRLESAIKNWFDLVKQQYPNLYVYAYDVVNEAFDGAGKMRPAGFDFNGAGGQNSSNAGDSPWQGVYGADNIEWMEDAFTYARRHAPAHTKLFYNDYNEWQSGKKEGIRDRVLIPFFNKGILDGMGMQSHVSANPNDGWSGENAHLPAMDFYANIGKKTDGTRFEVQLTELDPSTNNGTYASQQPTRYRNIFQKALDINKRDVGKVTAIIMWCPNDANTWLGSGANPSLHDASNNRKPAYEAVAGLVPQSEWGDGNNPTFEFGIGGGTTPPPQCTNTPPNATQGNLVSDGIFATGSAWELANVSEGAAASLTVRCNEANISITSIGTEDYTPQLIQQGIRLESGKAYTLSFRASAAGNRSIVAQLERLGDDANGIAWGYKYGQRTFNITTSDQTYSFNFDMNDPTDERVQLAFNFGAGTTGSTQDVKISNVVLVASGTSSAALGQAALAKAPAISVKGKMLNVQAPAGSEMKIRLIDVKGKVRANFTSNGSANFSLKKIPAGRYFIEMRGAGVRQNVPVILK